MAGEITIQSSVRINAVAGGLPPLTHGGRATLLDQTNKEKVSGFLALTTTPAAITLTALTAKGVAVFENIGDTNSVIIQANDEDAFTVPPLTAISVVLVDGSTYKAKSSASTTTLVFDCYGL